MIETTFSMPTESNAQTRVAALFLAQLSDVEASWSVEGDTTYLFARYPLRRAAFTEDLIGRAHWGVRLETTARVRDAVVVPRHARMS
ncbi:MAG: hypothetical protein PGN07_11375 [Aeromicrobium erythreum]